MKSLNDTSVFSEMNAFGEGGRRVAKTVLKNFSAIIAIFAMVVLITLIFADIEMMPTFTWAFATKLAVYLFLMYVLFFSMQTTGIQDGRAQTVYAAVMAKYEELRDRLDRGETISYREAVKMLTEFGF